MNLIQSKELLKKCFSKMQQIKQNKRLMLKICLDLNFVVKDKSSLGRINHIPNTATKSATNLINVNI